MATATDVAVARAAGLGVTPHRQRQPAKVSQAIALLRAQLPQDAPTQA